ncbi:histidine phosphatase family protein [Phenylobacterium sp. Root700]|uniref:histidine phosphatase family protein n=1 Tax=Phenylobacterium sp. Root700 TaxID=1736591 RepID=UPI0006FD3E9C|nr:histidine phosphatase family protein [Phenylobacterium sp. Root700]KRB44780.1 phosphoglycerate kinase [Phenylobacterium sp. Root700]
MSRLYLIRHGKPAATWGEADEDPGLDDAGKAQADAARDYLMSLPEADRPKRVVSSPLRRCRETAMPTAQALGVDLEIDPAVGEIPTPAGLSAQDRPAWLRGVFQGKWKDVEGDLDYEAWRGEIVKALHARGGAAVFSHYVAINAVMSHLDGDERVLVFRPDHASISTLETGGDDLILVERGREASSGVL